MSRLTFRQISDDAVNEIISEYNQSPSVESGRADVLSQGEVRSIEQLFRTRRVTWIRRKIDEALRRGDIKVAGGGGR